MVFKWVQPVPLQHVKIDRSGSSSAHSKAAVAVHRTVFGQLYEQLGKSGAGRSLRLPNKGKDTSLWRVTFVGEGGQDLGGAVQLCERNYTIFLL